MSKENKSREIISPAGKMVRWICTIILLIYTAIAIFVLLMTLLNSFKTQSDLITNLLGWPKHFSIDTYKTILLEDNFLNYFKNSMLLTTCGTLGCVLLSSMAAYGMARYNFKGKSILTSYFLIGMMVPIQVSVLPLFIILKKMFLLNKLGGLILVYAAGITLPVYIFQKFFRTIPTALEESARIDGAGDFKIFFRIILPICKPVIFTIALITAIGQWNDFYMPMVFLGKESTKTLTLAIYQYIGQFVRNMNLSFGAVIITLIPVIALYFLFSKQMVEGLTGGAVKG